ncbi:nucleotidyltransferase family protein [Rhodoferax ferrireducens]|uniref:nucleotidyltransferase domain-containing protein n=1 Tax=Rhodoferax ferrireducens TaxID=192843 RepID=UPI000E0CEB56|nr:nucleotidyltransferase family protein [Rhodoferax ferrireducens]
MLLGQARQARLLGRLAQHHAAHGWLSEVPAKPRQYLEGALRLVDRQHHEVQWEVHCIRRALKQVGTPIVMLKGAAYFVAGLPPRHGRLFSDIDIMVKRERLPEVEGALFRAGWIGEERDAYNERYYREWMHEIPPLRHVQRGTVIDVHHTITPPTSRFKVDGAKLLERIEAIDDAGDLFVLAPEDMVLHSAVHLFQEGEFDHGLRDLLDLKDLLEHFSLQTEFWLRLFDRAHELGLQIPLFHALFHIRRLFGVMAPAEWMGRVGRLSPPAPARIMMAWLLGLALRPDHPSCDTRWTDLARWLLFVRSHALRMPLHQVVPHLARKAWMRRFPVQT